MRVRVRVGVRVGVRLTVDDKTRKSWKKLMRPARVKMEKRITWL